MGRTTKQWMRRWDRRRKNCRWGRKRKRTRLRSGSRVTSNLRSLLVDTTKQWMRRWDRRRKSCRWSRKRKRTLLRSKSRDLLEEISEHFLGYIAHLRVGAELRDSWAPVARDSVGELLLWKILIDQVPGCSSHVTWKTPSGNTWCTNTKTRTITHSHTWSRS